MSELALTFRRADDDANAKARLKTLADSLVEHGYATDRADAARLLARALSEPLAATFGGSDV